MREPAEAGSEWMPSPPSLRATSQRLPPMPSITVTIRNPMPSCQRLYGPAQASANAATGSAAEFIAAINPDVKVETHNARLTVANAVDLIGRYYAGLNHYTGQAIFAGLALRL